MCSTRIRIPIIIRIIPPKSSAFFPIILEKAKPPAIPKIEAKAVTIKVTAYVKRILGSGNGKTEREKPTATASILVATDISTKVFELSRFILLSSSDFENEDITILPPKYNKIKNAIQWSHSPI